MGRKALADKTKGIRVEPLLSAPVTHWHPSEFKKISEAEKPNAFKGLLKGTLNYFRSSTSLNTFYPAYQTEIDNLTKRSKTSENAFLNVYKVLAEAPDPYPLLEAAVVRSLSSLVFTHLILILKDQTVKVAEALEAEAELRRLREENVELRRRVTEFASVETSKKKLESRVEQLEQKARYRTLARNPYSSPARWMK